MLQKTSRDYNTIFFLKFFPTGILNSEESLDHQLSNRRGILHVDNLHNTLDNMLITKRKVYLVINPKRAINRLIR